MADRLEGGGRGWQSAPLDVVPDRPWAPYLPIAIAIAVTAALIEFKVWDWFIALRVQLQQVLPHVGPWA